MIRMLRKKKSFSKQVKAQCKLLGTKMPLKSTKMHLKHFVCLSDPWGLCVMLYRVVSSDSFFLLRLL